MSSSPRTPATRPSGPTPTWPPQRLAGLLRAEVALLRSRESRRVFDTSVNVGVLSGAHDAFVVRAQDLPALDHALRTDVVGRLLEQTQRQQDTVWLCRPGDPELQDRDLDWLAASAQAFAAHGRSLSGFFAVTRYGWLDVRTGERKVWKRLRA